MGRPTLVHSKQQSLDIHLANTADSSAITTTLIQQPQPSNVQAVKRGEANTRVQLQKQRLEEQQYAVEYSLTKTIPGLKTSAAFFTSLRTNLALHTLTSPPPTPPPANHTTWSHLPPPSPLSIPVTPTDSVMDPLDTFPLDNFSPTRPPKQTKSRTNSLHHHHHQHQQDPLSHLPELKTYPTLSPSEREAGLKLIADSIAQQRQTANKTLIFHPLHLTLLIALLAVVMRGAMLRGFDKVTIGSTCSGIVMAYLLAIRMVTQGYLSAAEEMGWEWLGGDAEVYVTTFGDEVIGTVVVEWVLGESGKRRGKRAWFGVVRGWSVRLKYRGKGVGVALLEEVVKEMRRKGGEGVEFSGEHANAKRVLPSFYNGVFDKRERRAREALLDLLQSSPRGKRK